MNGSSDWGEFKLWTVRGRLLTIASTSHMNGRRDSSLSWSPFFRSSGLSTFRTVGICLSQTPPMRLAFGTSHNSPLVALLLPFLHPFAWDIFVALLLHEQNLFRNCIGVDEWALYAKQNVGKHLRMNLSPSYPKLLDRWLSRTYMWHTPFNFLSTLLHYPRPKVVHCAVNEGW